MVSWKFNYVQRLNFDDVLRHSAEGYAVHVIECGWMCDKLAVLLGGVGLIQASDIGYLAYVSFVCYTQ